MLKPKRDFFQAIATVAVVIAVFAAFESLAPRYDGAVKRHLATCERCGFDPHAEGGPSASAASCPEMREMLTKLNKPVPLSIDEMIAKQAGTPPGLHIGVIGLPK